MQRRYFDSGVDATAGLFKEMLTGLTGKGVLSGAELGVSGTDRLLVGPYWVALSSPRTTVLGLTRNALLLNETETQSLIVPTTTPAASYTVVLYHDDSDTLGGAAASLTLQTGLLQNENIPNGVVLGWVVYPGGAIPLAVPHCIPAPQMRVEARSTPGDGQFWLPPFTGLLTAHQSGDTAVVTNGIEDAAVKAALVLDNTANLNPSVEVLRWTFVAGPTPPGTITLDYVLEAGGSITGFDIQDTEGTKSIATIPGGTLTSGMLANDFTTDATIETYAGPVSVRRRRLRITNGTFQPGKRFRVQATVQTAAGQRTLVTAVGHSSYRKPFST